jgi:diacylglycerol O-acyltransferase
MRDTGQGHGIGFMNALDGLFLVLEGPDTPMHVGALMVFGPPPASVADPVVALREQVARRLDASEVLTRRLAGLPLGLASPAWVRADDVDLDHHVRRVRLPAPGSVAQLHDAVAALHSVRLERDRPLWQIVVVQGLESGRIALYAKVHHAGLDGEAAVALARALFGPSGPPGSAPSAGAPRTVATGPAPLRIAAAALAHDVARTVALGTRLPGLARAGLRVLREAARDRDGAMALLGGTVRPAPRTVLNGMIGAERAFSALSVPLAGVRAIAARHRATVNDVVLAAVGQALRDWLDARGELPPTSLMAAVAVSLRRSGDPAATTQAGLVRIPLATDCADPHERLRRIRDAAAVVRGALRETRASIPTDLPVLGLPWIGGLLATAWARGRLADRVPPIVNVIVSNVPGPRDVPSLFGARLEGLFPMSIPYHGCALNVTVQSRPDALDFGLVACRRTVPDIGPIAQRIADAFHALSVDRTA